MGRQHRVVVADDHEILRQCVGAFLRAEPDFVVVGEAADGFDAIRCVRQHKPDLVIMNLSMPRMGGVEAIRAIKSESSSTRVVALTSYRGEEFLADALRAGADGYVVKEADFRELLLAARSVLAGYRYISPQALAPVIELYLASKEGQTAPGTAESLTPRETQILKLIAEGHSGRQIAELLCLSPKTVEKGSTSLKKKLGMKTVAQLTAYALEKSLVSR